MALDWALSVAHGIEWLGHATRKGAVIYVAAEGGRSFAKRVAAWMRYREIKRVSDAFFILESVQVRDEADLELLSARIAELGIEPVLIVLDTLARCFVGGDENSAKEMGEFVDGLAWLQQRTGAAVMVIHHSGVSHHERERGSTALRGATDVMIRASKSENVITVSNNKQKDDEEFPDINLRLKQVALDRGDTSCVLETSEGPSSESGSISGRLKKTLSALVPSFQGARPRKIASAPHSTMTTEQWMAKTGLVERTFHSHRKALIQKGFVELQRRGVYRLTEEGHIVLGTAATATRLQVA